MRTLLDYINESSNNKNEVFPGVVMHTEGGNKISLHLQQEKVYVNGNDWDSFLKSLKSEKVKQIILLSDLSGYHKGSGLYINLDDCSKLDGLKIKISADESLFLIKQKGKCIISNFYFEIYDKSYPTLGFDIASSDSLTFTNCNISSYYVKCTTEKLPEVKNTKTSMGQLAIIMSRKSPVMDKLKLKKPQYVEPAMKNGILGDWAVMDDDEFGGIQIFFNNFDKTYADGLVYKSGDEWFYDKHKLPRW